MLVIENLLKKYEEKTVVNNVSFKAREGRIFGVLGRNGAGKSTIFRLILNIIKQDEGKIMYKESEINHTITNNIGYLPEEISLTVNYTVLEQMQYFGSLKLMEEQEIVTRTLELLEKFNILEYATMKIKDLSKGNKQKIQFIAAVLHDPTLIILDEPFSGLDPVSVNEFKEMILSLKSEDKVIIFSSHRMDHTEALCDDILILNKGELILSGDLNEIKEGYETRVLCVKGNFELSEIQNLEKLEFVKKIKYETEEFIKITINKKIYNNDIIKYFEKSKLTEFYMEVVSLETIFEEKVGNK